jgi:hypothetical protein
MTDGHDLAQQIRDRLELPTLLVDFTETRPTPTPEQIEEFRRRYVEYVGRHGFKAEWRLTG